MTPAEYCQEKAAKSGSSFYYSFLFLPKQRREAITALYAFCREVDDIADECNNPDTARIKLEWWRQELARTFADQPSHPVSQALLPAIRHYELAQESLEEIIDGMEMDLQHVRYPDFKALQLYCHRVAGVVGQLAATIFGYSERSTLKYAHNLGIAFQLTNIIRDVGEDARRNRIYLPQDELRQFNVTESDILAGRSSPEFRALLAHQTTRAHHYYQQAMHELQPVDRRNQRPGLVMAAIYQAVLKEIVGDDYPVLKQRISLTPIRKLWLAWRTWVFN